MKNLTNEELDTGRWVLGLGIFAITAASYAQWSNPADDVPAYHPSAPLKVSALPPILAGASSPARTSNTPGRSTSTSRWPRWAAWSTSSPATAAATGPWATPACAVASRACTAPSAPPAPKRVSSPTSRPSSARPRADSRRHRPPRVRKHRPGKAVDAALSARCPASTGRRLLRILRPWQSPSAPDRHRTRTRPLCRPRRVSAPTPARPGRMKCASTAAASTYVSTSLKRLPSLAANHSYPSVPGSALLISVSVAAMLLNSLQLTLVHRHAHRQANHLLHHVDLLFLLHEGSYPATLSLRRIGVETGFGVE
jgi:hypothetical protein